LFSYIIYIPCFALHETPEPMLFLRKPDGAFLFPKAGYTADYFYCQYYLKKQLSPALID